MTLDAPKALDLFCGCGGISAGLRNAGVEVLAGVDIEPNYISTFKHNFPDSIAITDDLLLLSPKAVIRKLGLGVGDLDILAGGPPCQGFSKNVPRRDRYLDNGNNKLVGTFLSYAEEIQPRLILMENVAEMKNGFDQSYTDEIVERLNAIGYSVSYGVLNAADFGVPQRRRRAFFMAARDRQILAFPSPSHAKRVSDANSPLLNFSRSHVTVWDAIGDLPSVDHDNSDVVHSYRCAPFSEYQTRMRGSGEFVTNHKPRKLAPTQYSRLASLAPGEGLKQLPENLRPKSGYSGAYGRLTKDMVAPTITRWVFHPGSGRYGHPEDIRVITIREAARLQGFSDSFEFVGTYTQQAGQIGNAVPPLLAEAIVRFMIEQIDHSASGSGLSRAASNSVNSSMLNLSSEAGKRKRIA